MRGLGRLFVILQRSQVKTAIHVDHLSGRVIELSIRDGANGAGNIYWLADSGLRQETACDFFVV